MTTPAGIGDRPLRAGVVGLGMMGRHHARIYGQLPDVELTAVADPDPEALQRATRGRLTRGYADPRRMFAEEELDLVSVVVPTSLHARMAIAALERGINVLVEKPIAADRDEAEQMIETARRVERILTVGHIERFNPAIRELRARLQAGELGRIFQIRASRLGPFPAHIRDVGVVVDLATHDLDVMRFLGGSDPVRLYGETARRIHTGHEDLFCGLIKFRSGVIGVLDVNWLTPTKKREVSVTGELGMFVADYITQDLFFYRNRGSALTWENRGPDDDAPVVVSVAEGEMERAYLPKAEPLGVELAEFARAVREGGPPPVDPRDAMIALLLARKMMEAAETGRVLSEEALLEALR